MSTDQDAAENAAALARMTELGIHKPTTVTPSAERIAPPQVEPGKPRVHDLKVQTQFWADLWDFKTTAQLRQDDRQYRVGDVLLLREYNPEFGYTGMNVKRRVTHILRHEDVPYGVRRGWCILSTAKMDTRSSAETFHAGFEASIAACIAEGFCYTPMPGDRLVVARDEAWVEFRDAVDTE